MLLDLPVVYHGDFYSVRSKAWQPRNFVTTVSVELTDMGEDYEVAAASLDIAGEKFDVIWHQERLWIRERPLWVNRFDPTDRTHMEFLLNGSRWLEHVSLTEDMHPATAMEHCRRWLDGKPFTKSRKTYNAERDSTFDWERRRLDVFLQDVRLLDGCIYRCTQPHCFKIEAQGRVEIALSPTVGAYGSFRLDRADDVRAFLEDNFGSGDGMCDTPDIKIPHAFRWDDEGRSIEKAGLFALSVANRVCTTEGRRDLRARLRETWEAYVSRPSERNLEPFVDAMEELAAACASIDSRSPSVKREMELAHLRISSSISRWRLRPLSTGVNFTASGS